jgi:hypothetical protein
MANAWCHHKKPKEPRGRALHATQYMALRLQIQKSTDCRNMVSRDEIALSPRMGRWNVATGGAHAQPVDPLIVKIAAPAKSEESSARLATSWKIEDVTKRHNSSAPFGAESSCLVATSFASLHSWLHSVAPRGGQSQKRMENHALPHRSPDRMLREPVSIPLIPVSSPAGREG